MDNILLKNIGRSQADMLRAFIGNTYILEYGIIKKVPAKGIVTVEMSVADSEDGIIITNCVYANLAGSSFALNIKPNVDDKVIVFFPRRFLGGMFKKENNEPLVSECGNGYSIMGGIAFPMNQYQESTHKNYIDLSDGNLTLKLGYDEDEGKNMFELTSDTAGNVTLKNDVTTVTIGAEGDYDIDNGASKISVDKDGNVTIDAMRGKVSIKNNSANLFTILDGMLQILNTSLATAGSPANHQVVPQQFSEQSSQLGQLMQ